MSEEGILPLLWAKHVELERLLSAYRRRIALLEADLGNMRGVLQLHEQAVDDADFLPHMSVRRAFKRGEIFGYCRKALEDADGSLDTRELARVVLTRRGMDPDDSVLRRKIVYGVMSALRAAKRRHQVEQVGRRRGVLLWQLSSNPLQPR